MALTKEVKDEVLRVWSGHTAEVRSALTILSGAILDLSVAVHDLEAKVERAERLAGRHGEDLP